MHACLEQMWLQGACMMLRPDNHMHTQHSAHASKLPPPPACSMSLHVASNATAAARGARVRTCVCALPDSTACAGVGPDRPASASPLASLDRAIMPTSPTCVMQCSGSGSGRLEGLRRCGCHEERHTKGRRDAREAATRAMLSARGTRVSPWAPCTGVDCGVCAPAAAAAAAEQGQQSAPYRPPTRHPRLRSIPQ